MSDKCIGTHSGVFHADEATACWMLVNHTKGYKDASVIRSRDKKELEKADILVDVGAEFDVDRKRFDHHQREFYQTFSEKYETKLSSAGLVYKYFGKEVIKSVLNSLSDDDNKESTEYTAIQINEIYEHVYTDLVEGLDGIDNGIKQYDCEKAPRYKENTSIAARVSRLNPLWNEECSDNETMKRFKEAMQICGTEFLSIVERTAKSWLPAHELVAKAVKNRFKIDASGHIMELEPFCPWIDHYFEIESKDKIDPKVVYVLFAGRDSWRVRSVPLHPSSFTSRKALPKPWQGVRDEELSKLSGIDGCIFVHASGFIGGNKTRDGAFQMAKLALKDETVPLRLE